MEILRIDKFYTYFFLFLRIKVIAHILNDAVI